MARVLKYILTQYSLCRWLKTYGQKGIDATQKELKQLHDLDTYEPLNAASLPMQKRKMLSPH